MPELPDVTVYGERLEAFTRDQPLETARVRSLFLVRAVEPPLSDAEGRRVVGVRRLGKRIVLAMEGDLFLVFHLMIAGRLRWKKRGFEPPKKAGRREGKRRIGIPQRHLFTGPRRAARQASHPAIRHDHG